MELATVIGACTATVKDDGLAGRKLTLVRRVDEHGQPAGTVEVALDPVGAGLHSTVLLVRGSAARQPPQNRQLPVDLTVVAVVDDIHLAGQPPGEQPEPSAPAGTPARSSQPSTQPRR